MRWAFMALIGNEPVGFSAYHHTTRYDCDAELQSLYVLPHAQRQGVGLRLLRPVTERLVEDGSTTLCVGYSPTNPYKGFYTKLGARELNPHWSVWDDLPTLLGQLPVVSLSSNSETRS